MLSLKKSLLSMPPDESRPLPPAALAQLPPTLTPFPPLPASALPQRYPPPFYLDHPASLHLLPLAPEDRPWQSQPIHSAGKGRTQCSRTWLPCPSRTRVCSSLVHQPHPGQDPEARSADQPGQGIVISLLSYGNSRPALAARTRTCGSHSPGHWMLCC